MHTVCLPTLKLVAIVLKLSPVAKYLSVHIRVIYFLGAELLLIYLNVMINLTSGGIGSLKFVCCFDIIGISIPNINLN